MCGGVWEWISAKKKFKTTELESLMRFFTNEQVFLFSIAKTVVFQLGTTCFFKSYMYQVIIYRDQIVFCEKQKP